MPIKDSGKRMEFDSGMVRDVPEGKIDYTLILDGPMLKRWANHLTEGAKKYSKRNWMKATGEEERERFKESALRHFLQWYWEETDEDHAAAILFNVNGAEYVRERVQPQPDHSDSEPDTATFVHHAYTNFGVEPCGNPGCRLCDPPRERTTHNEGT